MGGRLKDRSRHQVQEQGKQTDVSDQEYLLRYPEKISETEHISQYDGFGLYDVAFIRELRKLRDPMLYLRGLVAEIGYRHAKVEYTQELREAGKSTFSFMKYYDVAMLGITSSSKVVMRMAAFLGMGLGLVCMIGIFFVRAVQLFFLGFLGEFSVLSKLKRSVQPGIILCMADEMLPFNRDTWYFPVAAI